MSSLGGFLANSPIPVDDAFVRPPRDKNDQQAYRLTRPAIDYLTSLSGTVGNSATRVASVELVATGGGITATDITNGSLAAGVFRLSAYQSITLAGAPATQKVTLDWTEDGLARSFTSTGIDTTNTGASESVTLLIRSDGASPIRYSTTGTGFGGQYTLVVVLESVQA